MFITLDAVPPPKADTPPRCCLGCTGCQGVCRALLELIHTPRQLETMKGGPA